MSQATRFPRRWKVTLHVTDRPAKDEAYMSSKELFQVFNKLDLPAGLKIHMTKPVLVPEREARKQGAR